MIKETYKVKSIKKELCKEWLLYKHYAKRIPSISYSFGLFDEKIMQGILTVGKPASNSLCIGVCGKHNSKYVYELNRLCVNDGLKKNILSYFVSQSLKMLNNIILVSYADTSQNHNGYIYQATNWIYTGATKERTDIGSNNNKHSRHYNKNINYKKNRKFRSSKHRYIYIIASKKQRKKWLKELNYKIHKYPKGQNIKYDASHKTTTQTELF
jgi:hypothetical protein|tara:strand:- start:43 stop:678 length:636 start_codon:yes stop_codon:yes gene_type:complete